MKNIKRYFANGAKPDDTKSSRMERCEAAVVNGGGRKRERVKIRITRASCEDRVCDIVESKNDLIDKTPSPFAPRLNDGETVVQDGTPKRSRSSADLEDTKFAMKKDKSKEIKNISQNVSGKNKTDKDNSSEYDMDLDDSSYDNAKSVNGMNVSNVTFQDDIGSQREESNAFQVLMNRSKPIQYKQSMENAECKNITDNTKETRSKRKEKLIALADKKGYSKRKLAEAEDGERIEKNIESRVKLFKSSCNERDDTTTGVTIKNNRQLSGNLLNYFSKSPSELTKKDVKCASTFIVKADVHRTDVADAEPVLKPISKKIIYSNKRCLKSNLDLSNLDDIQVIASENLVSPQTIKQNRQQREKPRWALRIRLHSSEDNSSYNDSSDDEIFSPRNKSKFNADLSKSQKSYIEEESGVHSKKHNGRVKIKARSKEQSGSLTNKQKNDGVETNIAVDDNNGNSDIQPRRLDEASETEQKFNGTNETVMVTDDSECEIITENLLKRKPNEKLAPLFTKRRKTAPIVVTSRRSFLQSDMVACGSKTTDRKLNNTISMLPFPLISHVAKFEDKLDHIKPEIKHKFSTKFNEKYSPSIDIGNYKYITNYNETPKATVAIDKPVKDNFEQVLSKIEEHCPDVRRMWETISMIKDESEKKPQSRVKRAKTKLPEREATKSVESIEDSQAHDCMWTYKYKPTSAQDVVGNEEAVRKLKDWLSGWRVSLTRENGDSSGDEFYSSDCSRMSCNENNQVAVLLGPHGSGKSASVYAIAEELGYSVLEVNGSSRRTGKRILKELEEATKSHRIRDNKHKSSFEPVASESETPKITQNSLIFLEDIDLVFEEDEGFVSAAYQLASNTKRPIVMTCRNACLHLNKMAPQQNKIYFQMVNGSRVSVLLELISLAETGHRLSHNCLMKLLQAGDLRKALLQLQYLLLSGSPVLTEESTIAKPSIWQDMQRYLYKPAIKLHRRHKVKKAPNIEKSNKRANDIVSILNCLADNLDGLSQMSSLIDIEDTMLNISEAKAQPNLSLAENLSLYSASRHLSTDMANFMKDRILYRGQIDDEHAKNQSHIILRKQLNEGVDVALSHITSACLDRRVMALDYLPTARAICRAEESRTVVKRGNRFFHYLHGLKVPAASMKPNILAAACRTLQERVNKSASVSNTIGAITSD